MSHIEADVPRHTWRVLGLAAVGLLLGAMLGIALISAGVFDPRPLGDLQLQVTPGERAAPAGEQHIAWQQIAVREGPFSARLSGAYAGGERDIGYGLALGNNERHLIVAVSPLAYVSVWEDGAAGQMQHMPWQTWPHVRGGRETNEIQVDLRGGDVAVRLNRERLWQGTWRSQGHGVGLYTESFGGPGQIFFRDLELYWE
jgi:hypothetical protein